MGTPQYLSPEQAQGGTATPASDVYSLGVVAFECLAGRRPFVAETAVATALMHLREPVPELPADVPADLAAVVRRAMAKTPEERFPDGRAFAAALRDPSSVVPVAAGAVGARHGRHPGDRHRRRAPRRAHDLHRARSPARTTSRKRPVVAVAAARPRRDRRASSAIVLARPGATTTTPSSPAEPDDVRADQRAGPVADHAGPRQRSSVNESDYVGRPVGDVVGELQNLGLNVERNELDNDGGEEAGHRRRREPERHPRGGRHGHGQLLGPAARGAEPTPTEPTQPTEPTEPTDRPRPTTHADRPATTTGTIETEAGGPEHDVRLRDLRGRHTNEHRTAPHRRPLRARRAPRPRRDGRGPQGHRHPARPGRRGQAAAHRPGQRRDVPGPVPPRGAVVGLAEPPRDRRRLRHRRGAGHRRVRGRPALHRHGVRRRPDAARDPPRGPQDPARAGPRDHQRRAVRARLQPPRRHHPPRHQARQRDAHPERRREGDGLRHRPRDLRRLLDDDPDRRRGRHRAVPLPRAGPRRDRRLPLRRLLRRLPALRAAHRPAAVRRRQPGRRGLPARPRAGARRRPTTTPSCRPRSTRS